MQKFCQLILLLFFVNNAFAQSNNNNGQVWRMPPPTNSVLNNEKVYKIAVAETGVYKISKQFLSDIGVNLNGINPLQIKVYGNGYGNIPEANSIVRNEDIAECAILQDGLSDGQFDNNDAIYFYGKSPFQWYYDNTYQVFRRQNAYYTNKNYYYIIISDNNAKTIENATLANNPTQTFDTYNSYTQYETDKYNYNKSGKDFIGELFDGLANQTFGNLKVNDINASSTVKVGIECSARSIDVPSSFTAKCNNQQLGVLSIDDVTDGAYTDTYKTSFRLFSISDVSGNYSINLNFNKARNDAKGWLNFISVNALSNLKFNGNQLPYRNISSANSISEFSIQNANENMLIWDVSEHNSIKNIIHNQGNYIIASAKFREFIAFQKNNVFTPEKVGYQVAQNLHGITVPDMLIVYHPDFKQSAEKLAQHRRNHNNFDVACIDVNLIFNEFGCGSPDPTSIRDFCRHFYLLDQQNGTRKFQYLLLFGKASYDFKNIQESEYNNFVPTFETNNTNNTIYAFPTDDYFGLLDDNEGANVGASSDNGKTDLGIGRFPVTTPSEAMTVVNKIIHYETNKDALGSWRQKATFIGDDEDSNSHMADANIIADNLTSLCSQMNVDKLLSDAYVQVSTSAGQRYPDVSSSIKNKIQKGNLILSYSGHGGPSTWAEERLFSEEDIGQLNNYNTLPLLITATCEFSPFDFPGTSAGEMLFLDEKGGASALFTTTRAVYQYANRILTNNTIQKIFNLNAPHNIQNSGIGIFLSDAKNATQDVINSRKFALIGDPAMKLSFPKHRVATLRVNGRDANIANVDTLRALSTVTIEGAVTDEFGNIKTDFNGIAEPTIYDKRTSHTTRNNDNQSAGTMNFTLQRNIIYRGYTNVTNGLFSFTFLVPRDINYSFGNGKISYYAYDKANVTDAGGSYSNIVIGGTSSNTLIDNQPPIVEAFMDSYNFTNGQVVGKNATLLAKLSDDIGINISGNSIGHDILAVIDNDANQSYILNDYYLPDISDNKKGYIDFPIYNLSDGNHTLTLQAWDLNNNVSETTIHFVVKTGTSDITMFNSYPNPFHTQTHFNFTHNLTGIEVSAKIEIYSINGTLLKTIKEQFVPDSYVSSNLIWDGTADNGTKVAKGIYICKLYIEPINKNIQPISKTIKISYQ